MGLVCGRTCLPRIGLTSLGERVSRNSWFLLKKKEKNIVVRYEELPYVVKGNHCTNKTITLKCL